MDKIQEAAKKRILRALEITGWKSTTLAKEAGVAPSTINRFLNQDVGHTISFKTMVKVDEAVKRYIHSIPDMTETIRLTLKYEGSSHLEPVAANTVTINMRGVVQAGQWSEAMERPAKDWQKITLPRPGGHKSYFGLRVKGPSMNQVYPEGTILVCVPFHDYGYGLEEGDHVIVQRWDAGQVEATVKELRKSPEGNIWLWPRSDHPKHQTPIALPRNSENHPEYDGSNEIRVAAIVVADYRVRTRPRSPKS